MTNNILKKIFFDDTIFVLKSIRLKFRNTQISRKKFEQSDKLNFREGLIRIYIDDASSIEKLFETDSSLSVHQLNLNLLLVEVYKTISHLYSSFRKLALVEKIPYNLTSLDELQLSTCLGIKRSFL